MKYIKPKSVAWWSSVTPLIGGVIVALAQAFPQLAGAAQVINSLSGGLEPAVMVNMGLIGIGLRGAVK